MNSHFVRRHAWASLVGYKYVHLYAELTGGYVFCNAPTSSAEAAYLGGVTFLPVRWPGLPGPRATAHPRLNPAASGTVAPLST